MGKHTKRNNAGAAAPLPVIPKKLDAALQSLMDYGDNLKEFVAICAHLPVELKADLRNVMGLEQTTYQLTKELSRDQAEILERAKAKYRQATRPEHLETLIDEAALEKSREKRRKVDECVSEKVAVTSRMYDALDSCIKHIDEEISKLEHDVEETYGVIPELTALAPELLEQAKQGELAAAGAGTAAGELQNLAGGASGKGAAGGAGAGSVLGGARAQDVAILNEPLYCVCHRIGFGDMIGCDNEDCEHGEWFHIACVYLQKVDGSFTNADGETITFWLCPGCQADTREKQRREALELTKAASLSANAVKVPAVKLPEEGEEEDDDEDEEEGEGTGADKLGKTQDKKAGDHTPGESTVSAAAPSLPKKEENVTSSLAADDRGSEGRGGVGGASGDGAGAAAAPQSATTLACNPPKEEGQAGSWQGLGVLGSNALAEGTILGTVGVTETEKPKGGEEVGDGVRSGVGGGNDGQCAVSGNVAGFGGGVSGSATALAVGAGEGGGGGSVACGAAKVSGEPMVGGGEPKDSVAAVEQNTTLAPADLGSEAGVGIGAGVLGQGSRDAMEIV